MSYIDTKAVKKRLGFGVNSEVQRLFTNECAREMNEFVPKDIGILRMLIDIGYDYIEYKAPMRIINILEKNMWIQLH